MTEKSSPLEDQTNGEESLISAKSGQTKAKKNQTDNVKWSIFTEAETKTAATMAAKRSGMKLNEWIDKTLREAATSELTTKPEPPAKLEDVVNDLATKFADSLKAETAQTMTAQQQLIEAQGQRLTQLAEALESRPATLKEFLFGKSKKS